MTNRRADIAAHLLLASAAAVAVAPLLLGRVLYYGDITLQFVPWRQYASAELLAGRLPLWIPEVYGGMPFLANDQSAVLYPLWWLLLPFAPARQVALGCLVHLYLGAAGMFAFVRGLGHRRAAALIAGLAFGLSGFVLSKQQFPSLAGTLAWLPWLLWSGECLLRRPSPGGVAGLALLVGLQFLAGHAQASLMQLALLVAWSLRRGAAVPGGRPALWVALAVGGLLGAAQLVPTLELLRWSGREAFEFEASARFCQPAWQWPMLLWPRCLGCPQGRLAWLGVGAYWEQLAYGGLTALPLAVAGGRGQRFWQVTAILALILAAGRYLPIYEPLWNALPPLRVFRDPARFQLYAVVAAAVLAARGVEADPERIRRAACWALGLTAGVWVLAAALPASVCERVIAAVLGASPGKTSPSLSETAAAWRADLLLQLVIAAVLLAVLLAALRRPEPVRGRWLTCLLAVDLLYFGWGLNPTAAAADFLADPRPAALPAGRRLVWVSDLTCQDVSRRCFNLATYRGGSVAAARRSLAANTALGTGVAQVGGYDPLRPEAVAVWLIALDGLPREEAERQLGALGVEGEWRDPEWRPFASVAPNPRGVDNGVTISRATPQRWSALAPAGGVLALTQTHLPGWRVDSGRLEPGDGPLETRWYLAAAAGRTSLRYEPTAWKLGCFCALLGIAAVAALAPVSHRMFTARQSREPFTDVV